jgi:hypothetical protein
MSKNNKPIREVLIDNILDLSGDEFETNDDLIQLAKKSDEELVLDIINIAQYYKNLNNE